MMLALAAFVTGDSWTWGVTLTYEDASGALLEDRERWTVRVEKAGVFTAERAFLGTVVEGAMIPGKEEPPEILKGKIGPDGTLTHEGEWSDAASSRALRRLLRPDAKKDELLAGWALVRRKSLREADARVPGGELRGTLRVETSLEKARLGGREIPLARRGEGF